MIDINKNLLPNSTDNGFTLRGCPFSILVLCEILTPCFRIGNYNFDGRKYWRMKGTRRKSFWKIN